MNINSAIANSESVSYYVVLFILQEFVKLMCVCTNLSTATMLTYYLFLILLVYLKCKMYLNIKNIIYYIYNIMTYI